MTVDASIFYQNLSVIRSKFYHSNIRYQFCMTSVLLSVRSILHLRKYSKHCTKSGAFLNK